MELLILFGSGKGPTTGLYRRGLVIGTIILVNLVYYVWSLRVENEIHCEIREGEERWTTLYLW